MNGTDVIVSTPCTFKRMLEEGHASVARLCHLFIDDADIITKEFPLEVGMVQIHAGVQLNYYFLIRNNELP